MAKQKEQNMKIPPKKVVRRYELTYIVPGNRTSVQVAAANTAVKALAEKGKISVIKEEDWGKKELAYAIRHQGENHREGYYHHLVIEADPAKIASFERNLQLNNDVMRHLLVIASEDEEETSEPEATETEETAE